MSVPSAIRAKLRAPRPPPHYVHRPRLIGYLDEIVAAPLTVVIAPAGAGKTSLLCGWLSEYDGPSAWLSLDESDRDVMAFWRLVIAALRTLKPSCGERAEALLRERRPFLEVVGELLDDLDEFDGPPIDARPSVLVIDDAHYVEDDSESAEAMACFVTYLPRWLRVVVVSRRLPNLPLGRLRARGQLGEVHFSELRFSPVEANEMLVRVAPSIREDQIHAIAEQADGLAVGLQIAALTVRAASASPLDDAPIPEPSVALHRYLIREVFAAEPPELMEMLLDISVVSRVNPRLATALTRRPDADAMLQRGKHADSSSRPSTRPGGSRCTPWREPRSSPNWSEGRPSGSSSSTAVPRAGSRTRRTRYRR